MSYVLDRPAELIDIRLSSKPEFQIFGFDFFLANFGSLFARPLATSSASSPGLSCHTWDNVISKDTFRDCVGTDIRYRENSLSGALELPEEIHLVPVLNNPV